MRNYRVNADSWTELLDILRNDESFNGLRDSLHGEKGRPAYAGRLSGPTLTLFSNQRNLIDYVIYSYATPIAWRLNDGTWVIPEDRYSVTTSKHQGKVRTAVQVLRNGSTLGMFPTSSVLHRGEAVRDWHAAREHTSYA